MDGPNSTPITEPDVSVSPPTARPVRAWMRIFLFVLHAGILIAAIALTPENYAFQLGAYTGPVLIGGCILLWLLLYAAKTRATMLLYCALAVAQSGFVISVVLQLRQEDRVTQQILLEGTQKQKERAARMGKYAVDPLFQMCSGKRTLSDEEMQELGRRAKNAQEEMHSQLTEVIQWDDQAESRLDAVSPSKARQFRLGVQSTKSESHESVQLGQEYYSQVEKLIAFLIERKGAYRVTGEGLVFNRNKDVETFNDMNEKIAEAAKRMNALTQKLEELQR